MAITRVKLDGTAAGLLQLLQDNETEMAVLTTGVEGTDTENTYSSDTDTTGNSYPSVFNIETSTFYYPPTTADINQAALFGFNLGQVSGGGTDIMTSLANKGKDIANEFLQDLISVHH